jgi:hypothetical protein
MGGSGFVQNETPANVGSLHVPFTPQVASNWCWAATTTMILQYESRTNPKVAPLTQCQYVQQFCRSSDAHVSELWRLDSLPLSKSALSYFDGSGNPFIAPMGHDYKQTRKGIPLTYSQLQAEFLAGRPVIFGWQWQGLTQKTKDQDGAHFLLAEGTPFSSYFNGDNGWVSIHDPMPVGRGRHRIIRYSEYANKRLFVNIDHTKNVNDRHYYQYAFNRHYYDMYGITYTGK